MIKYHTDIIYVSSVKRTWWRDGGEGGGEMDVEGLMERLQLTWQER